jgi:hypothetical protein
MRAPEEARLSDPIDEGDCPALLIVMLTAAIEAEAADHSSLEWLEQLKTTKRAALWLFRAITNSRFRALLIDSNEWAENELEGLSFLCDIAARAAQAQERNPRKAGPGRPRRIIPATAWPSALEFCALIAGVRWRATSSQWPGKRNPEAQRWCEQMWMAARGNQHGGLAARDGALTAWEHHLKAAKQYVAPHPVGAWIAHILSEATAKKQLKPRPGSFRRFYIYPRIRGVTQLSD